MSTFGGAGNPMPESTGGRSHLVAGTRIVGDITAPGVLEIQGEVRGRVEADSVVIEERGIVDGEVQAAAIGVKGTMSGQVNGGVVRIHATARMSGTVRYEQLSIESGAEITAGCERVAAKAPAPSAEAPANEPAPTGGAPAA